MSQFSVGANAWQGQDQVVSLHSTPARGLGNKELTQQLN
jgi:hypothetical protein